MKKSLKLLSLLLVVLLSNSISAKTPLTEGYRGFISANWLYGNDGVYKKANDNGFGFYTTHGYQLNKNIFIGAGVGYQSHKMDYFGTKSSIPCYADFRVDFGSSSVTPFFEAKAGYSTGNLSGIFLSPNIGVRIPVASIAFNIGVAYAAQQFSYDDDMLIKTKYASTFVSTTKKAFDHNLNISLGVEF